jgi:hypothetical protein
LTNTRPIELVPPVINMVIVSLPFGLSKIVTLLLVGNPNFYLLLTQIAE